jgi:regulator of replication initiation timing
MEVFRLSVKSGAGKADVKKKEAEEKSAGITAIASLTKDILEVRKEIHDLKDEDGKMIADIGKLRIDYDSLINRFLDFLRK